MSYAYTVLYHGPHCPDGFASAMVCWQQFGEQAEYIPVAYNTPPPHYDPSTQVYIVDFSYQADILLSMHAKAVRYGGSVTVLDHHASAKRELQPLQAQNLPGLTIVFDMQESGATLAWKWFGIGHDEARKDPRSWHIAERSLPLFLRYVRDRDLWLWREHESRAISMALSMQPRTFDAWHAFAQSLECQDGFDRQAQRGKAILAYADRLIAEQTSRAQTGHISGYMVPIVNTTTLFSEVGEHLCMTQPDIPFCAYFFLRNDGKVQWGLRGHGKVDLSVVASAYGGGGHPNAAGFTTTVQEMMEILRETGA